MDTIILLGPGKSLAYVNTSEDTAWGGKGQFKGKMVRHQVCLHCGIDLVQAVMGKCIHRLGLNASHPHSCCCITCMKNEFLMHP